MLPGYNLARMEYESKFYEPPQTDDDCEMTYEQYLDEQADDEYEEWKLRERGEN